MAMECEILASVSDYLAVDAIAFSSSADSAFGMGSRNRKRDAWA